MKRSGRIKEARDKQASARRPYEPPHVEALGEIRDVTLRPSAGTNESGGEDILKA